MCPGDSTNSQKFALKSSQAISHIMKVDPASDCRVTHHKPTNETEQVSEMLVFDKLRCS